MKPYPTLLSIIAERENVKTKKRQSFDEINSASYRAAVRDEYTILERRMFSTPENVNRIQEILALTRAQMADDTAANDRARFGGARTLSLDAFAEAGWEPQENLGPSRVVQEAQEALEYGARADLDTLSMDQLDAVRGIYRYGFSYRDTARRLGIKAPALQRRIKAAIAHLTLQVARTFGTRTAVCKLHGEEEEGAA